MIPPCVQLRGVPFGVLPPGIHWASLTEIGARFGQTHHRAWLFDGVAQVAAALRRANCARMYLDGSFVTEKIHPNDFDGCWDASNVSVALLDPLLLNFNNGRAAQKQKYRGEMFIADGWILGTGTFLDFFQREKLTGSHKGIVGVDLQQISGTP
jgi:uncharacterized protein DUF6932